MLPVKAAFALKKDKDQKAVYWRKAKHFEDGRRAKSIRVIAQTLVIAKTSIHQFTLERSQKERI